MKNTNFFLSNEPFSTLRTQKLMNVKVCKAHTAKNNGFSKIFKPVHPQRASFFLENYHWGYESHNGPETWCLHYDAANGKEQSPIDIDTTIVETSNEMENIENTQINLYYSVHFLFFF